MLQDASPYAFSSDRPSRVRILEEVRQLTGVRDLRVLINGPDDKMVQGIEQMIRERRLRLYGCD